LSGCSPGCGSDISSLRFVGCSALIFGEAQGRSVSSSRFSSWLQVLKTDSDSTESRQSFTAYYNCVLPCEMVELHHRRSQGGQKAMLHQNV